MEEEVQHGGVAEITSDLADPCVWREVEIAAEPEAVWELIASDEGRELWLGPDADRALEIVEAEAPKRLVWWWSDDQDDARRVELLVVAVPAGSRVIVIESAPSLPLTMLAQACRPILALA